MSTSVDTAPPDTEPVQAAVSSSERLPVFVDPTEHRARYLRVVGVAGVLAMAAYLVVVAFGLAGPALEAPLGTSRIAIDISTGHHQRPGAAVAPGSGASVAHAARTGVERPQPTRAARALARRTGRAATAPAGTVAGPTSGSAVLSVTGTAPGVPTTSSGSATAASARHHGRNAAADGTRGKRRAALERQHGRPS